MKRAMTCLAALVLVLMAHGPAQAQSFGALVSTEPFNTGAVDTELWVTYFDVPAGGAFRLDAADPGNCAF